MTSNAKKAAFDQQKASFKEEWTGTQGILQSIQQQMSDYRPGWVSDDVPTAWQVDQFLHAYYYNRVGDSLRKPYEEYYRDNKSDPASALKAGLSWWKALKEPPTKEDLTLYTTAPAIRRLLEKGAVLEMTLTDFASQCGMTDATMDHLLKVPVAVLGRPDVASLGKNERLKLFAPMVMSEKNSKGWGVKELLNYVLYGGEDENLWERIFHAGRDEEYRLPRYGLNSIAEVAGWARPELAIPRNGRTSKALRALGYDVHIY